MNKLYKLGVSIVNGEDLVYNVPGTRGYHLGTVKEFEDGEITKKQIKKQIAEIESHVQHKAA